MTTRYGKETTTDELLEGRNTLRPPHAHHRRHLGARARDRARRSQHTARTSIITARDAGKAERAVATIRASRGTGRHGRGA